MTIENVRGSWRGTASDEGTLFHYLDASARRRPDAWAIEAPDEGRITYHDLGTLSDHLRDRLKHLGVGRGDRVGICLRKSIDSVVSIFGVLKSGAAYVPVDVAAPSARNAYILNDCSVRAVVLERRFADGLRAEIGQLGNPPQFLVLEGTGGGLALQEALKREQDRDPAPPSDTTSLAPDDLAYILYTSGSTGKPKGVMLSHRNATSFVDWCSEAFQPDEDERFSSHAPLHFDLSILDLYVPIKHGATVVLIREEVGKDPTGLARLISDARITSWYSTPSVLSLLVQYGKLERLDYAALRRVLFAGEVFPVKHLRALKSLLPAPRYFNLYGPTETNVCTFYEIPQHIPEEKREPFPIGKSCSHLETRVVSQDEHEVIRGEEGELLVSGPAVMRGYWNLPERTAAAFLTDASGWRWYRTGDIVVEERDGNYRFVGRRDRMVKRRGYRIELGEIEAALYRQPAVEEAAVVALLDSEGGVRIKAILSCRESVNPSVIALKRFCAEQLPPYMVPDFFSFRDFLPKTSTDKIDYQRLREVE
jgi:amino acid adenylation domain-containing protein